MKDASPIPTQRPDQLTLFAAFLAAGTLLELGKWSTWQHDPAALFSALAAILLLLRPSSLPRLGFLSASHLLHAALRMPWLTNHTILCAAISFLTLGLIYQSASCPGFFPRRSPNPDHVRVRLMPQLRTTLALTYLIATFHKLNTAWFDPHASCAIRFWNEFGSLVGMPRFFQATAGITPWLAILIEALLPVLLAIPKTRTRAILLGLGFHLFLGWISFFRFSSLVTTLYVAFLSDHEIEAAVRRFFAVSNRLPGCTSAFQWIQRCRNNPVALSMLALGVVAAAVWLVVAPGDHPLQLVRPGLGGVGSLTGQATQVVWAAGTIGLIALLLPCLWVPASSIPATPWPQAPMECFPWILPAFVLLLGVAPYLGVRTQSTFAMFSNLRVTGTESNHLLFRRPALWNAPAAKPVHIIDSSDPELLRCRDRNYAIPWIEFCSYLHQKIRKGQDPSVTYEVDGTPVHLDHIHTSQNAFPEPTWWRRQLLCYRSINLDPECQCSH